MLEHFPFFTCFCLEFTASQKYSLKKVSPQPSPPPADQVLVEVHNLSKMCIESVMMGERRLGGGEGVNLNQDCKKIEKRLLKFEDN